MFIGLTGGISSGKSTVSKILKEEYDAVIVDADEIAKQLCEPGEIAYLSLKLSFTVTGETKKYFKEDGSLNRKALAELMFTDKVAKKNIENMMHKNIVSEMMIKATRAFIENKENNINRPIVFDAALLIEAGLHKHVSKLIVVNIDPKEQLRRLMNRNGFSEDEAQMRINAQMSSEERLKYADYVLDNNQDLEHLKLQIYKIMEDLGHTK